MALLLGACVHSAHQDLPAPASVQRDSPPDPGLEVPGTFSRVGSCGGEWGDEVFLTLLPDGVFSLRQMYRDGGCAPVLSLVYIGRWSIAEDGRHLRLDNGPIWLRRLTIMNRRTLSIPEQPATTRPSPPVYRTSSLTRLVPFREPFQLRGLVSLAPLSQ